MSDINGVGTWNTLAGSWLRLILTCTCNGLYEITISGWSQGTASPYLTTWSIRSNGTKIASPHYGSPIASMGTDVSTTKFSILNSGDVNPLKD